MKAFVVLAVVLGASFGAPTEDLHKQNNLNERLMREIGQEGEHMQRSYYDLPASVAVSGGPSAAAAAISAAAAAASNAAAASAASPAVGVFPGAKIGGCAIPLLLSCAPSIHSGHIASSYAAPVSAYRTDAEHKMRASEMGWAPSQAELEPTMQRMEHQRAMEQAEMAPHRHHNHHHHIVALDIHPKMNH